MAKRPTMFDEVSYTGYWWLPENPDERWSGTVFLHPQRGLRLQLISDPQQNHRLPKLYDKEKTVHGLIGDAPSEVTLLGCQEAGNSSFRSGVKRKVYNARLLLKGILCSQADETRYENVVVELTSLEGWMHPSNSGSPFNVEECHDHLKATYPFPTPLEFYIPSIDAEIVLAKNVRDTTAIHNFQWSQSSSMEILPAVPKPLNWFLDNIFLTRELLAFLTGNPIEVKSIEASAESSEETQLDQSQRNVSVYFSVQRPFVDDSSDLMMPMPLSLLEGCTPEVFNAWFQKQQTLRTVIELSLAVLYNQNKMIRFEFLALMQALESYHRIVHPEKMSLKRRLSKLYDKLPCSVKHIVRSDEYIQTLVDTRHWYSHYIKTKEGKALQGSDLYEAVTCLILFVLSLLFKELEIPENTVGKAIERVEMNGVWRRSPQWL